MNYNVTMMTTLREAQFERWNVLPANAHFKVNDRLRSFFSSVEILISRTPRQDYQYWSLLRMGVATSKVRQTFVTSGPQ